MIRIIGKYVGIGILIGIGLTIVDIIYYETYAKDHVSSMVDEVSETMSEAFSLFYQPGYVNFWEAIEKEHPEALLRFNLERAKILEDQVQITGVVENHGPIVWSLLAIEVEAFDADGNIFAECHEIMKELEPGAKEHIVTLCPFIEGVESPILSEMSFRIAQKYEANRVVPPIPNK